MKSQSFKTTTPEELIGEQKDALPPAYLASLKYVENMAGLIGVRIFYFHKDIGKWPYWRENAGLFATMIALFFCLGVELPMIYLEIAKFESLVKIASLIPPAGFTTIGCLKLFNTWKKRFLIQDLFLQLGSRWEDQTDPARIAILDECVPQLVRICRGVWWLWAITACICFNFNPLIERTYMYFTMDNIADVPLRQPYGMWWPFDDTSPMWRYVLLYMIENYWGFSSVIANMAGDFMIFALATHIVIQLRLLSHEIETLDPKEEDLEKHYYRCVEKHQFLLWASDQLDDHTNLLTLGAFAATTFSICFCGVRATAELDSEFYNFVLALLSLVTEIYMLCFYGERLQEASNGIADSAFNSAWYDFPVRVRQLLLMTICRAQKPSILTAVKMREVNKNSFIKMISTSYSYFTLIRTMMEED